jgi:hypothetical protein
MVGSIYAIDSSDKLIDKIQKNMGDKLKCVERFILAKWLLQSASNTHYSL